MCGTDLPVCPPPQPIPRGHLTGYRHPPDEFSYVTISMSRHRVGLSREKQGHGAQSAPNDCEVNLMRGITFLLLAAGIGFTVAAPKAEAQVSVEVGVAPDCPYGYYDTAP